jgi:glycosyltransferase involved in cell wall biosynthesis
MFSSGFTGIGRYTFELVRNLERLSIQDPENQHQYVLFFNKDKFSNYDNFKPTAPNFEKVEVDAPHYSLKEQTSFLKAINAQKLDLMHFTHFNAPIRYKRPFIVTIHDLTHTLFPGRKMTSLPYRIAYKSVIKSAVKKAKKVIAVSENTKQDLIKIHHVPSNKIEVVYEGANEDYYQFSPDQEQAAAQNLRDKYNITAPFLLYTGVHRYHKNLPRLIEAFEIIAADIPGHPGNSDDSWLPQANLPVKNPEKPSPQSSLQPQPITLVITGKKDPLYPEPEQEVAKRNLAPKVHFPGHVPEEDLIALYNLAEAYVFPSLYEGFGLPVLEAMQCGTPVVASNVSSIPEVAGADNALFFDPENPQDIAQKTTQLLQDPQLQAQLREKGLQRVKAFSWGKMAKEILALYNS